MDIFELFSELRSNASESPDPILGLLADELRAGLTLYRTAVADILKGSGIALRGPERRFYALKNNFFSLLFLYSFHRGGIPAHRRVLYAAVNHCLRGMVTGCDNLLDDEYKATLDTDLPERATRFRSVIDIMASDRALFAIMMQRHAEGDLSAEQVLKASAASLHTLSKSGVQEASEEGGGGSVLEPSRVLEQVHHCKTGLLFLCPWGVPAVLEPQNTVDLAPIKQSLYQIGMGCQIMDDMVDLARDVSEKRHNYVVSLVCHESGTDQWARLEQLAARSPEAGADVLPQFPDAHRRAAAAAQRYLEEGLTGLFSEAHRVLVQPAIAFLCQRIGTQEIMKVIEQ